MTKLAPVPGFEGLFATDDGHVFRRADDGLLHILNESQRKDGYRQVSVKVDGKRGTELVHRLVLLAFVGPAPASEPLSRHLNGKPDQNDIGNLAWGNAVENAADTKRHGKSLSGEKHPNAKLTQDDVNAIRHAIALGVPRRKIADRWDVTKHAVSNIATGRTWRTEPSGPPLSP